MSGQDIRTHHQRASVQHIHPNTPSEAIRTTYPDRICCCPGVIIVSAAWAVAGCLFHPDTLSGQDMLSSGTPYPDRICYHPGQPIWIGYAIIWIFQLCRHFHPDVSHPEICFAAIPPGCLTSGNLLRHHSTRMSHIRNSAPPPFHPDVSHLAHSIRRRFNFPGRAYPDALIASTRRVSQIICTVPRCSPEASRYLRPTLWDILLQIFYV